MDCVAFDKHLKALMQREHLEKAQVNLSVNRFQAEYGKDSFPTDDWIIKHSTLKVGAAKKEAGVTKYPSVVTDSRKIEMQRVIALANNRLFKQGIKRVYFIEFEATDIVGQNYRWKLTTQIGDLDLHAKYQRQAAFDTTRGRQESLPTKDTKKLIYGAKPGKQLDLFGNVVNPNDVADFMDEEPESFFAEDYHVQQDDDLFAHPQPQYIVQNDVDLFASLFDENNKSTNIISTIQESVNERYFYIAKSYDRQIESLRRQKQKHTYRLKTHEKLSEKEQEYHKKEEQKYRRLITQIQNKQLDILKIKAIEEIITPTQTQLAEISKKLDSQVVITDEEIAYLYDILDGIIHLGEFEVSKHRHWFFTEEELRAFDAGAANPIMNKIKKQLEEVASEAKRFKNKLNELIEKNLNEDLKATFEDLPAEQQISLKNDTTKDVQYLFSQFIDISEHSDPVFAAIHRWNKDANYKAKLQATEISETFDKLFQKALPILRKHQTRRGGIFDLFMQTQSNQSSMYTGNLVDRYSQSYWNERNKHLISPKLHMTSTRKALSWIKDNELTFNANILFGDKIGKPQDQLKAKQIELLKKELGEEYFEELYKQAEKKVNEFLDARQAFEESLKDELGDNAAAIQGEMEAFDTEFSPFEIANFIVSPSSFTHKKVRPNFKYIVKAPRRTIAGKDTGYYDAKYDEIQKNADLKALYDYYMATMEELKNILPTFNRNLMQRNVIPTVKTTILENFVRSGVLHGLRSIWDSIRDGISTQDEKTDVRADIDLATGAEKKSFRSSFAKDYKRELVRLLNIRIIAYFNEHGQNPPRELKETWKKELTNQLSQQKSFDLGRVLKSFAYLTLATYHKQEIEAQMILAKKYIDMKIEQNESNSGTSSRDIKGRAAGKKGSLPRLRAMVDYMYDNFYGYPSHKREVKLTKKTKIINEKGETEKQYKTSGFLSKIYTGIDKNVKKETLALKKQNKTLFESGKLTKDEYAKREKILDEYLNSSGRIWILSMHLDKFLQYVQLNGMGWNIQSGILNMLFGFFANTYEGGAGRIYNMKQLMAAYGLVTSSVFRNATAHVSDKFGKLGITAIKIRNLMNKFDILKESRYELYKPTQSSRSSQITKRLKFLSPYNIQSRTEYINQATAMIATLMNIQITDQNGKSASLWSALDQNGKLKEKFRTPENIKDFEGDINIAEENRKLYAVKARLDKVIKINHGNYDQDSPLLLKRVFVGRMISQFRTWAFEGFKERYQSEKYDAQLGMTRKGRYRSGAAFLLFGDDDVSFWQANNAVRKNILKKLTIGLAYKNTKSLQEVGIKQVDIDNLRKNMMEGLMYLTTIAIKYLIEGLKKAGDDDEEDDQILSFITWFIPLNMINRLETDILFYFNPKEAQNLLMRANTIVPLAKIITDFYKISDAIEKLADDNPQNDVLRSGPNKGENVLLREFSMALPGISGGRRLYNMGQKDYDKLKK